MNLRLSLLPAAISIAVFMGCYTGSAVDTNRPPGSTDTSTDGTEPTTSAEAGARTVAPSGLPCDVAEVVASACSSCHGATPSGGAPNRLLTYEDFAAPSDDDPDTSVAELALLRMKSTKRPMPPSGGLSPDALATFEKWVDAKLPRGQCGGTGDDAPPTPTEDAGVKDAAPDATSVCTSGQTATSGAPSALMKPGRACIACHSQADGPAFELAGTVYDELHEPNDCHGMGGVKVLIIDATGATFTMTTNAAGNFMRITSLARPYRAIVIKGNNVREMKTPQTDGDCNGCHSEWGRGAPGRIMAP